MVSEEVKLTVVQPITITQQPVAEHVLRQDQSLLLEVVASGSQPISYQWHRDDVLVDGANSFRYEVANAKSEHTGQYKLVMSNEAGEVVSEPASVVVYEPVSFVELPGQVQVFPGETATFNVSTSGTEPIEYQWLYENQPLSGATRKTLTLNNVQESHTGKYRVVASNPAGKVTSPEVRLLILKPAVITTHPIGDVLRQGETLTMAVGASGTEPLHFEWKRDGQVLDGFTGSKVEISDVQLANGGTYTVTVSNEGGAVTSDEATVVVNVPITLVSEPKDRMVPTEASVTFEVEATGTEPLTYQWLKNGEPVAGATASTFIIGGVSLDDSGGYQVLVTNPAGDQLSRSASLRVAQPVSIVTQPQSAQIREGQPYELSVLASGSEPISYQWHKNGEPVEGAVTPSLLIENAAEADGGAFHVVIGNEVGDLSSAEAIVEVLLPPSVGDLDELKEVYKGSTVSLTAPVSGYGTFNYQWLKNGVNIPGAIDKTLVLVNVTMQDSGSYSLNVGSEGGALYSNSMNFRVLTDAIELADAFSDAVQVSGANGEYRGSSVGATSETNEPPHGDRAASASVWMQWRAPGSGIATFGTKGSNFDTTLAVYTGETIEELQARAADADLGGYLTSKMRFNAVEGEVYSVAVDGFNGATGDVVLNWQLEVTSAVLPVITAQPEPTTGVVGLTAEFVVTLEVETDDIEYAWYKDDQLLAGETAKRLVFDEVAVSDNGVYAVQVSSGAESVMSEGAQLLIQFEEDAPDTEVNTKLDLGSFLTPGPTGGDTGGKENEIIFGGPDLLPRLIAKLRNIEKKPGEFSFSGATVYTTTGAAKDPGEPNHAGNTGGASAWTTFTPSEEGTAKLSTENSDFDTVLAIYKVGSGSGWDALEEVASDDNSGGDGEDSEVVFDVEEGATYFVAVDGVGGETGTVQLNHELSQTPVIDSVTESADGLLNGTVTLEVAASSPLADAELTYQWRRDGNLINGATAATLSLADLQYTDAGDYTVEVSSFAGDVTSDDIPVRVIQPVTIGTQPASVSGIVGGSVVLEISVTGTDPITYQWKHAGEDIEGGTDATLTLASLTEDSAGEYQAVVTNPAGSVLSDVATLTVETPPVVATLTEDQNVIAGETVELSVTATGSQPMTYAWKRDGALIDGQTDASLTLPDIAGTDAGVYSVEITNSAGLTESDGVTVSVVQPVSIASQPEAATIVLGGSTLFQVAATGTEPITYQWSQDGTAIADATESTLTLTTVEASAGGEYKVTVTNAAGSVDSDMVTLTVESPPTITALAESMSLVEGDSVELLVTAVGTAPITYQWSKGGVALAGATGSTLSLSNVAPSDADDYKVAVSNGAGRVESDSITVTVAQPASIVSQPEGGQAVLGETFTLSVVAAGTEPISYQWYVGGQAVEGAEGSSLSLANVEATNSGEYHVVVSNHAGTETSDTVSLSVESPPVITGVSGSLSAVEGDTVELSVTAVGTAPLAYQWSKGGVALAGATGSTLSLANVAPSDADDYKVAVSNGAGRVESDSITVTVAQPASIVSQPEGGQAVLGETFTLSVVAAGTEPISYQWYVGGQAVEGAEGSSLSLANVEATNSGEYHVVVSNHAGTETSDTVNLSVESPPVITEVSGSLSAVEGETVELSVTAVGTAPITYQWSKGGVALAGATGSTLSLSNVAPSDADDYKVAVSNGAGRVESDLITVTVAQPASIVSQPEGGQAVLGETFTLSVVAAGTEPLIYKWYRDGELIFGAGLASLTLADLGAIDSGTYRVAVQNLAGTVESDLVNLSVETPPEITQQPASLDVAVGGDITLSVAAIGSEPLAYQWSRDGVLLSGATGAELTLTGLEPSDAGSYTVSISNFAGLLVSDAAIINAIHPIVIAEQPSGSTKVLGETVTVAVAVTGSEPISYQWLHNGNEVAGANGSTIVLENLSAADAGQYRVRVSNPAGELLSQVALVLVDSPPEIVGLSGDQSAPVGGSVELTVEAVGNEPLAYQWAKDGVLLDGATSASLALANLDTTDSGSYTVVVTNAAGRLESDPIAVNVIQPVSIVLQPSPATAAIGGKVVFEVAVTGSTPVSYQWNLNGEPVADETAAKLVIDEVAALDGGTYTVTASNASNSVESDGAELTIQTPPIITKIAGDQQAAVGETVTLWVTAVGTPPLSYQWKREGVVIPGGTGDSLELSELVSLDAGQYTVEISNSAGSTVSDPIEVSVAAAPQIVGQPASKNIGLNARLILTVSATGSGIAYQWYRDGGAIEGATEAVLTVPNAGSADSGTYHVIVTNSVGSATSETAEVVVVAAPDILTQPEGGFAPLGGEFVMSVEAKGAGEVTYQWRVDGVVLEGRTQNVLNLTGLKLSDAGVYAVEVVNAAGITKSEEAEVQVLIPVSVIEQPQNQSVVARSLVMFEAVIGGSSPISYQWYFNGNPVAGAVEPSLRIENASNEHLGDYHLVASNPVSTVTSEAGTLVVNLPPTVASHPAGGTVTQGDDTTFVVEAAGTGPFTYKWQRDGEVIPGATGPALTLMDVDAGDDALYTVLVENPYGLVVSEPARLEVTLPVSITGQPADTHVALDGTLTLNVTAAGTGPFEYQWYRGDDKIEGAVEAEMQIPKMTRQKDGLYRVEVKNLLGALFSRKAEVVVDEPVSVTVQPAGATLLQGEEAVLWVLAKGSEPLSYQWQKDGVAIEGATGTSLTLSDAVEADEGNYSVIITNPVGFEVSAEALVKVNSPPTVESLDPVVTSVGDTLQVQVVADDADGDISKLRYVLRNQPAGMKISPSGLIEWSVSGEAEIKSHKVTIIVIDQSMLAASGRLTVRVNAAPAWEEIGLQTAVAGRELAFTPVLVDADDTEWSYATGDLPEGASFDPVEGFNWTPGLAQVGAHEVALTATDPHGASGTITVQIEVEANAAPAITPLEPVVVMGGGQLKVQVSANDPDGDNAKLKYKLQNAPVGMSISAGGLIEWTVPTDAPGGTLEVTVVAMDELSGPASILAVIVNLPPALTAVAPQTVSVGQALEIKPSAIDPEGGEVVFSARDLPTGAGFDPSTGFNWTPTADQLGVHEVVFVVNDPHGASDEETVIITVTLKPNTAPTLEALEPVVVTRGDTLSVQAVADDPDGDNAQLKYQLQDAPAGMTVSATGLIEWATGPETASGTMEVTVIVLDELESMSTGTLSVTVNLPPVLTAIGPQTVQAGQALAIKPSATDPNDADPNDADLVYTATDLPAGAVFEAKTGFRWTPADDQVGVHDVTFAVTDPHGAKASETVAVTVTEAPKAPPFVLLSSATVVGEFAEVTGATLDEDSKTFTVKRSGGMRFYRLRAAGETKPKILSIRLQDDNAVITFKPDGE